MLHATLIPARTNAFVAHLPHIAFVLLGVIAYFWVGLRQRSRATERFEQARTAQPAMDAQIPRRVGAPMARRALTALAPLIGAVATGAVLYGLDVGRHDAGAGLIWTHTGFSILAMMLVAYKLKALGGARLRHALRSQRLSDVLSLVLGALLVPLLVTGVMLLVAPSIASFTAYLHLVASAWWTTMLVWHLWRYMGAAVRSAKGKRSQAAVPPSPAIVAPAASPD